MSGSDIDFGGGGRGHYTQKSQQHDEQRSGLPLPLRDDGEGVAISGNIFFPQMGPKAPSGTLSALMDCLKKIHSKSNIFCKLTSSDFIVTVQ